MKVIEASPVYRCIMLELERRRVALGWSMDKFSEYAGLPDRYFNKALSMDAPSGKQANWSTLQLMIDALFPAGFDLIIRAHEGPVMSEDNLKAKLLHLRAPKDPRSQRQLMAELGRAGRAQQLKNQSPKKRKAIARNAAVIRWEQVKAAVRSPDPRVPAARNTDTCPKAKQRA